MQKVNLRSLKESMAEIKKQNKPIFTNYYLNTPDDIEYDAVYYPNVLAFSYLDNGINRVFIYGNDVNAFQEALSNFKTNSVMDCLSKNDVPYECALSNSGYKRYALMQRMVNADLRATFNKNLSQYIIEFLTDNSGVSATIEDADIILGLLNEHLDKYTGHFCSKDLLIDLICNGYVICCKKDGEITSFFIYKIEGQKLYGYQMYSKTPDESVHGIYYTAINSQISKGINYAYNWVNVLNKRVIKFHKWYGFDMSPLKDYIYLKG